MMRTAGAKPGAFTLVEVLIVVAIMGIVLAMGIPSLVHSLREDAMKKTVREIVEACSHARDYAILNGLTTELYLRPLDGTMQVHIPDPPPAIDPATGLPLPTQGEEPQQEKPEVLKVAIPGSIKIEIIGVNATDVTEMEEAVVRFHANGTSDEFTVILQSDHGQWRKITLDIVTGLADVENLR